MTDVSHAPGCNCEECAADRAELAKSREQAAVFQLSNIIGACIDRIETNPDIVIPALLRVLAVEVVTAPSVMSWELRRANTHRHVRLALAEAKAIFDKAQAANSDV